MLMAVNSTHRHSIVAIVVLWFSACGEANVSPANQQPNVVLFVADDLGWGDVGYNGSEIRTPHIDRLAAEGVKLDRFYANPLCSPTRAALMTGRSPLTTNPGAE